MVCLLCAAATVAPAQFSPRLGTDAPDQRGQGLPYEVVDGWAVHAGDMVLGPADELAERGTGKAGDAGWLLRRDISGSYTTRLWPRGMIPYVIDTDFSVETKEQILAAIEEWNSKTVMTLFPRTSEQDYVRFRTTTERCRSQVGNVGGEQSIWWVAAGKACGGVSSLLHEIGHTVGLWHEHQRTDRDKYLTVREEGISQSGMPWIAANEHPVSGPYDHASVMHYHPFAHSLDGLPVMETIPPGIKVRAVGGGLSVGDIYGVAALYGRPHWWTTITSNPPGLEVVVNGTRRRTPALFFWPRGTVRSVEAPLTQTRDTSRYVFGRWSDDGDREHDLTVGDKGTWIQANYIVQHIVTASPHPAEAGSVTISPPSPDGYYTLRTALTVEPQADRENGYRFWKWGRWRMHGLSAEPARILVSNPDQFGAHFTNDPLLRIDSSVGPFLLYIDEETNLGPIALHPDDFEGPVRVSVPSVQTRPASVYGPSRFRFQGWQDGGPLAREVTVGDGGELVALFQVEHHLGSTASQASAGSVAVDPESPAGDGYYPDGSRVHVEAIPSDGWEFVEWLGDEKGTQRTTTVEMDGPRSVGAVFAQARPTTPGPLRAVGPLPTGYSFPIQGGEQRFRISPLPGATELKVRFEPSARGGKADLLAFVSRRPPWQLEPDSSNSHLDPDFQLRDADGGPTLIISANSSPPLDPAETYFMSVVPSDSSQWVEGTVYVEVDTAPVIARARVSPRALTFIAPTTSDAPPQRITLTNPGRGILRYRFGESTPWLHAVPREGMLQPNESAEISVRTHSAGIAPETYHRELPVRFSDAEGNPVGELAVQVAFAVVPQSDSSRR